MSFSKIITSIATPHMATIGTRYGTGGTGRGPIRRGVCVSTSRYSSRYAAKNTTRSSFTASHGSMLPGPTLIQIRAPLISRPINGRSGAMRSRRPRSAQVHLKRESAVRSRGMRIVAAKAPAEMIDQESCCRSKSEASRCTSTRPIAVSPAATGMRTWSP